MATWIHVSSFFGVILKTAVELDRTGYMRHRGTVFRLQGILLRIEELSRWI
jgi:hypothetical protein